jgi:Concanavalin A-like lectin/glucanases superfamily
MATGIFKLRDQLLGLVQKAWTGSQTTPAVEYLVVAGGGSGGNNGGGGGGAGGLLQGITPVVTGTSLTVTVGAGGASQSSNATNGNAGLTSVFGSINAIGGAGGGNVNGGLSTVGGSGGGGGGGYSGSTNVYNGGQGTSAQGNTGGAGYATAFYSGGGGGAGTLGLAGVSSIGGNGGAGIASAISGTVTAYAGGGGGSGVATGTYGNGGVGGGGHGDDNGSVPVAGTANTGGGGGGVCNGRAASPSGAGGSGICIISYPDTYNAPTSLTGTYTASTSGSGSILNTSSSCITYPNNTAFDFGSGNFTIEAWIYSTVASSEQYIFSKRASATFTPIEFGVIASGSNNRIYFIGSTSGSNWEINSTFSTGSINIPTSTWTHIALVRNGNVYTSYVNGVADLTVTVSGALMTNSSAVSIGASVIDGSNALIGNYSNVRVVKGTAVYTANFTPSTIPLTSISGTSLLMNSASGSIYMDASTNCFTPTKVGTSSWNQASPFATGLGYKNRVYTWTASGTVTF